MISRLCILALILALHAVADDKITTGTQEAAKELWTGTVLTRANSDPTLLPQILTVYFRSQKDPDVYPRLLTPEEELLSIQREIKSNLNAVGTYGNDYYGQIEINEHSGSLWMRFPDTGALYTLSHWDGDTFTYRFEAEQAIGTRGVVFTFAGIPSVWSRTYSLKEMVSSP